jgi:hypothetical protein
MVVPSLLDSELVSVKAVELGVIDCSSVGRQRLIVLGGYLPPTFLPPLTCLCESYGQE